MSKQLVWSERYNCHAAMVGRFMVNVNWSVTRGRRYEAGFEGQTYGHDFEELGEAKKAAIAMARRHLTSALAALPVDELRAGEEGDAA